METNSSEETIQSLVVPLRRLNLIVPQSMVLEVVPMPEVRSVQGSAPWLRGFVEWQGNALPLISLENMCDADEDEHPGRTRRLAVLRSINADLPLSAYALEISSIPHPVKMKKTDIVLSDTPVGCDLLSCNVQAAGVQAVIAEFEAVESKIAAVLPGTGDTRP